jgi:hypothetical protein
MEERIRIPNTDKLALMVQSMVKNQLNLIWGLYSFLF